MSLASAEAIYTYICMSCAKKMKSVPGAGDVYSVLDSTSVGRRTLLIIHCDKPSPPWEVIMQLLLLFIILPRTANTEIFIQGFNKFKIMEHTNRPNCTCSQYNLTQRMRIMFFDIR